MNFLLNWVVNWIRRKWKDKVVHYKKTQLNWRNDAVRTIESVETRKWKWKWKWNIHTKRFLSLFYYLVYYAKGIRNTVSACSQKFNSYLKHIICLELREICFGGYLQMGIGRITTNQQLASSITMYIMLKLIITDIS